MSREKTTRGHREKMAAYQPRREAWNGPFPHSLRRNHPAHTVIQFLASITELHKN